MPIPSFSSSAPPPSPIITPPLFHFPTSLLLSLNTAIEGLGEFVRRPTLPGEKTAVSCKSWTGPNTLVPRDLQSWRARVTRVPWGRCAYGSDC